MSSPRDTTISAINTYLSIYAVIERVGNALAYDYLDSHECKATFLTSLLIFASLLIFSVF